MNNQLQHIGKCSILLSVLLGIQVYGIEIDDAEHGFNMSALQYSHEKNEKALETVNTALETYPQNSKLIKLKELLEQKKDQQQKDQQKDQENKDQENKDQSKDQKQDQQDQDKKDPQDQQKDQQQDQKNDQEKQQPQDQQETQQDDPKEQQEEQLAEAEEMTEEEAARMLDAMRDEEQSRRRAMRYIYGRPQAVDKDW